jgi:hypothetical protein
MTFIQHNSLTHQHTCPTNTRVSPLEQANRRHQDTFAVSRQQFYKNPKFLLRLSVHLRDYEGESAILLSSITMFSPVPFAAILIPGCFS